MSQDATPVVKCRGGCGKSHPTDDAAMHAGWTYLWITKGYRCGDCERELRAAGSIVGTDQITSDPLPKDSRGALPKETASTIMQPSVRG
jgi:hypothetical protein